MICGEIKAFNKFVFSRQERRTSTVSVRR